jgi:hypothetical protein
MRRALVAAIALAAAGAIISGAGLALPSPGPRVTRSAVEHFRIISTKAPARYQVIIATGRFTAGGRIIVYKTYGKAEFPRGSFVIRRVVTSTSASANPSTCLFTERQKGTFALSGGTGRYRTIRGSGDFLLKIEGVLGRDSSGKCGTRINAFQQIIWEWGRVAGVR